MTSEEDLERWLLSSEKVYIETGRSLDALLASTLLADFLVSSGIDFSLSFASDLVQSPAERHLLRVGAGVPYGSRGNEWYVDYAPLRDVPNGLACQGSLTAYLRRALGFGQPKLEELALADPILSLGKVHLPQDFQNEDLELGLLPCLPVSESDLVQAPSPSDVLERLGISAQLMPDLSRDTFASANALQALLMKGDPEALAVSFSFERKLEVPKMGSLVDEALKHFFRERNEWVSVGVQPAGELLVLSPPSGYRLETLLPTLYLLNRNASPLYVACSSETGVEVWGLGGGAQAWLEGLTARWDGRLIASALVPRVYLGVGMPELLALVTGSEELSP